MYNRTSCSGCEPEIAYNEGGPRCNPSVMMHMEALEVDIGTLEKLIDDLQQRLAEVLVPNAIPDNPAMSSGSRDDFGKSSVMATRLAVLRDRIHAATGIINAMRRDLDI